MGAFTRAVIAPAETSGEDRINDLLGGATATVDPTELAEPAVGDTPVDGGEQTDQQEVEHPEETEQPAEGEPEEGEPEEGTEPAEEEDFEQQLETDYSERAYAKAAEHWAKRGVTLDPAKEGDRALIKDWLDRGRDARDARAAQEATQETDEETPAEETPAAPAARTPEQVRAQTLQTWKESQQYAKDTYDPEISKESLMPFISAVADIFWDGKGEAIAARMTTERIAALSNAIRPAIAMELAAALPSIYQGVPGMLQHDPVFGSVHEFALKERVIDELSTAVGQNNQPLYPNLERLLESDAIKKALNGPELKNVVLDRDPYKNLIARTKLAYKIANNERVDVKAVERAAKRGREQEQERQRRVASGKTPPGRSTSGSAGGLPGSSNFMQRMVGNTGSKFSKLLRDQGK